MVVVADTMTIGRTTQMAVETTHGSAPAGGAIHQLVDTILQMDPTFPVSEIRGTGRRFVSVVAPAGMEATAGKLSGGVGYNSIVYFLSMIYGAATITTPSGAVNARQWAWTVPLTGSINPQSMDIEQGDANDADQFLYCAMDSFGLDFTRAGVTPAGTLIARATNHLTPVGTFAGMTSSGVSELALAPVLPAHWSIFMDYTSAALGTSKLTRAFHGKFDHGAAFIPFFPVDNAQTSYGGLADGDAPKVTFLVEEMKSVLVDTTGSENLWPSARSGFKRYIQLKAGGVGVSPLIDNYQTLAVSGTPTGGSFTISYLSNTATIAFNSTVAATQTALNTLFGTGNVLVAGGTLPGATQTITFQGTLAQLNGATMPTIGTNSLTGGASPTPTLTATQIPFSYVQNMAGEVSLPGANKDFQGLRTREWTFTIVEDPVWGNALQITVVNALTGL